MTAVDPRVQRAREALASWVAPLTHAIVRDLLAKVDELQQWKSEAADVMIGLQDLGRALDVPLGTRITGDVGVVAATQLRDRAVAAEAEVERLDQAIVDLQRANDDLTEALRMAEQGLS